MKISRAFLLTISALLIISSSIHLHLQSQSYHYLQKEYINELNQKQTDLASQSISLQSFIQKNLKDIQSQKDIAKAIEKLEASLVEQRKKILEMAISAQIDGNTAQWTCAIIHPSDKDDINKLTNSLKKKYHNVTLNVDKLKTNATFYDSLKRDIDSSDKYVDKLEPPLESPNGKQLPTEQFSLTFFTNLNVPYWTLGNSTLQDIQNQYKLQSQKGPVTWCSRQQPFTKDANKCEVCPPQKHIFDLSKKECIECKNFDKKTHICLPGNQNGINPIIIPGDNKNNSNPQSGSNQTDPNQDKNIGKNSLFPLNGSFYINFQYGDQKIIYPAGKNAQNYIKLINKTDKTQCSSEKPFFDGNWCINCQVPLYFGIDDNKCQTCKAEQYFNSKLGNCIKYLYYSNLGNRQWLVDKLTVQQVQKSIIQMQSSSSYAICPITTPFVDQKKICIACKKDFEFSFDSKTCIQCKKPMMFNQNLHKCIQSSNQNYQTNPINSSNLIYSGKTADQWASIYYKNIETTPGIADCPKETPYFDGIVCIICPNSHPYFNLGFKICQECSGNTRYYMETKQCISGQGKQVFQVPSWEKMAAGVFS